MRSSVALATLTLLSRHRRFQSTVTFPDRSRPHQTLTSPPQPLAPTIQLPCLRTRPSRDVVSGVTRCPAWRSSPSATSSGSARVAARVRFPFRARRFRPSPWVASWLLPAFGRRDQRCCGRGRVWTGSPLLGNAPDVWPPCDLEVPFRAFWGPPDCRPRWPRRVAIPQRRAVL